MSCRLTDVHSELIESLIEKAWGPAVLSRVPGGLPGGIQRIFI